MPSLVDPECDSELQKPARRNKDELSEIQFAILVSTMGCTQPVGAYQIVQALQKSPYGGCMYPESCLYREIKKLVPAYLDATEWSTVRGTQTRYLPTWRATKAVRAWIRTPLEMPIEARNELWLRIAAIRASSPKDTLRGIVALEDDLDDRTDRLNLLARKARKTGTWDLSVQLEYQLDVVMIDACRRWVTDAIGLLEAKIEEMDRNRDAA
jgi:hypothetical protein